MLARRTFLWLPAAALSLGRALAAEKESPEEASAKLVTPEAEAAIKRGLAYLVGRQHTDGTFGAGGYRGNVAVVSLCGLALISSGSTPGRGPRGVQVASALDFVLAQVQESGFINSASMYRQAPPMYGHGFALLFLAEAYGMSQRADIREKLGKATHLVVKTQNDQGGWRYYAEKAVEADISVTACQVMGLRAARNAGIFVPKETIDRAIDYVQKSQNPDGGFMYMLALGGEMSESAFPRSAAAVVALYSLGVYDGPQVAKGLDYLMQYKPKQGVVHRERETWFFYGHYYAAMAMWQAGGQRWAQWYPAIRDELLLRQQPDGSWVDLSVSPEFATAAALLVLQMPNNYLPIFQR
jgi:hypothetical protein